MWYTLKTRYILKSLAPCIGELLYKLQLSYIQITTTGTFKQIWFSVAKIAMYFPPPTFQTLIISSLCGAESTRSEDLLVDIRPLEKFLDYLELERSPMEAPMYPNLKHCQAGTVGGGAALGWGIHLVFTSCHTQHLLRYLSWRSCQLWLGQP